MVSGADAWRGGWSWCHRRAAQPPVEQRTAASRAGEAFSWRGKKHNENSAAAREDDWQHQQLKQQRKEMQQQHDMQQQQQPQKTNASEGGGKGPQSDAGSQRQPEVAAPGNPKLGVMDRLGLVRDARSDTEELPLTTFEVFLEQLKNLLCLTSTLTLMELLGLVRRGFGRSRYDSGAP